MVFAYLAPYYSTLTWRFPIGTLGVLSACGLVFTGQLLEKSGLRISRRDAGISAALFFMVYLVARRLIPWSIQEISVNSAFVMDRFNWQLGLQFFQVLNDEIVLRAVLLGALFYALREKLLTSIIAAFLFSLAHAAYYYSGAEPVQLAPLVLLNLFLFSLVCNWTFFTFKHIGFAIALHAGWNLFRFSGHLIDFSTHQPVSEGQTFNLIESSLGLTLLIGTVLLALQLIRKSRSRLATAP